jgi:hypothetical protein
MEGYSRNPRYLLCGLLLGKEEVELIGLPRTTQPSLVIECGVSGSPDKVRRAEALLVKGGFHFVPGSEKLTT